MIPDQQLCAYIEEPSGIKMLGVLREIPWTREEAESLQLAGFSVVCGVGTAYLVVAAGPSNAAGMKELARSEGVIGCVPLPRLRTNVR
jgi:hypothetical protein